MLAVVFTLLIAVSGSFSAGGKQASAEGVWEESGLKGEYSLNETLSVPERCFVIAGQNIKAETTVRFPDGNSTKNQTIPLNVTGVYTVFYTAVYDGKIYSRTETFRVNEGLYSFSSEKSKKTYKPRVFATMLARGTKRHTPIQSVTVNGTTDFYHMIYGHGPMLESELVGYRVYFNHLQTIDPYGKFHKRLELKETQFYPDNTQKATGYGDDVLWVGSTLGLGTLRGWDGKQPTMLENVDKRSQKIIARGPIRTIVEVKDKGWTPQGMTQPIDMTALYTLYAGRRECSIDVTFNKPAKGYSFSTGIINVKNSTEYSDKKGLRGCWGTDWPVSAKDSAGHKRETVGLGIYIPSEYIVSEEPANKDNYAYVIATGNDKLHYKITFCSDNETFGYHSDKEWYNFLKEWKEDIEHPVRIAKQ